MATDLSGLILATDFYSCTRLSSGASARSSFVSRVSSPREISLLTSVRIMMVINGS